MFEFLDKIYVRWFRLTTGNKFRAFGRRVYFIRPEPIIGVERISIGDDVYVGSNSTLAAAPHTGVGTCALSIGDRTTLGRRNLVYATCRVEIGSDVLTADNVYVSDNQHAFENPNIPIKAQGIVQLTPVRIGDGSWLGQNVCVIGASIGRQCVIGANSVVMSDIPDFCVAVGAPARVVKRFDPATNTWVKVAAAQPNVHD